MKNIFLFLISYFLFTISNAQDNIKYDMEKGIVELEQQYTSAWKNIQRIDGFRIQIVSFSGVNSKSIIERTATQFKNSFSETPYYISYFEPNFRLRVGNYITKLEAYKALQEILPQFPGSFILKDQIIYK